MNAKPPGSNLAFFSQYFLPHNSVKAHTD